MVPFQYLSVWKWIFRSRGLRSLFAMRLRWRWKVHAWLSTGMPGKENTRFPYVLGSFSSISKSLLLRCTTRGLLFFSGAIFTTLLSKSMSSHFSHQISPHLAPVSFSVCRKVAIRLLQPAISWSISQYEKRLNNLYGRTIEQKTIRSTVEKYIQAGFLQWSIPHRYSEEKGPERKNIVLSEEGFNLLSEQGSLKLIKTMHATYLAASRRKRF